MLSRKSGIGFLLGFLLVLHTPVAGQSTAREAILRGRVLDAETGQALPGANILITSDKIRTGAASRQDGSFEIEKLTPATYRIVVSYIGYQSQTFDEIVVTAGATRLPDVRLRPTGITLNPVSISASRRPEKTLEAPASISVIDAVEISQDVATSSAALLRNVTGVDMATTGIDRREVVMRGFNNAFSGSAYILTDYRRAAVPSLDVNIHSLMPTINSDLQRIEIVRGPGSALYGAGVDAGVIHYFSKDPFKYPGTTVSFTSGERSSVAGSFRHAGRAGAGFGYKLTGQYSQADDWRLSPGDSLDAAVLADDVAGLDRNPDYEKFTVNALLQYQLAEDAVLTAAGGFSSLQAVILSGVGTVQADGFGYSYGQVRLQAGGFFAQAYLNKNDAGDSFIYGTGQAVVDNSSLLNLQAQYDLSLAEEREQIIVGVDYDRSNPDTEGTINGKHENDDLIAEFGIYTQSVTRLTSKIDFTAALRADHNNIESGFQFSPRAALVFKPAAGHNVRLTYNRAYDLPAANSLFLDIVAQRDTLAPGMILTTRGLGAIDGFTFNNARANGGITASGLLPLQGRFGQPLEYPGVGAPVRNIPVADIYTVIYDNIVALGTPEIQALLAESGIELNESSVQLLLALLSPRNLTVTGQAETEIEFFPADVPPLKSTITQSFEVGYKGLLADKLLIAVDGYFTKKKNFVSGVTQLTPRALYSNFRDDFVPGVTSGISGSPLLAAVLRAQGLSPGSVAALIADIATAGGIEELGVGVVQPDQSAAAGEVVGAFSNFGNVDFWGVDLTLQYLVSEQLNVFGNLSIVSDDLFDDSELDEAGTGLSVALNASKFKWKAGFSYTGHNGFLANSSLRFTQGFPVRSGPFIGSVEDYFLLDVGVGYDFKKWLRGVRLNITMQNALDNAHREFVGAPRIGRLTLARLSYTLP